MRVLCGRGYERAHWAGSREGKSCGLVVIILVMERLYWASVLGKELQGAAVGIISLLWREGRVRWRRGGRVGIKKLAGVARVWTVE